MGIEPQVKEILDNHGSRLCQLELATAKMEERFSKIDYQLMDVRTDVSELKQELKNDLAKVENTMLVNFNALLDYKKNTDNNKTQLVLKVVGIIGGVITLLIIGYFGGKGINVSLPC